MAASKLTPKQEAFVREYLIDLNATAAYKRAGYKATGNAAEAAASRMLRGVKVAAAIMAAKQERAEDSKITARRVLEEVAGLAFADIGEIMDFSGPEPRLRPANEISPAARRLLSSMKVKRYLDGRGEKAREVEVIEFRMWSKDSALEKLMKHLGLMVEKHEHKVDATVKQFDASKLKKLNNEQLRQFRDLCGILASGGGTGGSGGAAGCVAGG